jgi:hypothetical protein
VSTPAGREQNPGKEAEHSLIPAGDYQPSDLLGNESITPLTVNAAGGFSGYAPLPSLESLAGYVILIREHAP